MGFNKQVELPTYAFAMLLFLSVGAPSFAADDIVVRQDSVIENFQEQEITPSSTSVGNGKHETLDVPVTSWRDMPFKTVKKQALDYSCGSAALSTLLTYVYATKTSEKTIFKTMFEAGDKAKIRREGFSLLDMSNYLNRIGFKAVGYKAGLDALEKYKVPFVALINDKGYNHFVVVKSMRRNYLLIGDPNKGNVIMDRPAFIKAWNGIALVVTNHAKRARDFYDNEAEWRYAHTLARPAETEYAGFDSAALSPMQWQLAPVNTDILGSVNNMLTSSSLSSTGGMP